MAKTKLKPKNNKGTTDIWYTLIAIFVGVCLLAGLLVAILKPTGLWDSIVLHTNTAVKSEHYSVNNAQFQYTVYSIYNNYYQQYYSTYGSTYMSYFGFDRSKPLSEQKYFGSSTTSWLDACVSEAKANISQILNLCEAARAEGMTLTDENKKTVEDNVQALASFAKEYNYSFSTYVGNLYGSKGITKKDIRGVIELQTLAAQYTEKVYDGFTYTDEQYDTYYGEHKKDYLKADYYTYQIKAEYEKDADEAAKNAAIDAAKAKAEELMEKIENGEDFVQVIVNYQLEVAKAEEEALADSDDEKAKQDLKDKIEAITPEKVEKDITVKAHTSGDSESELDKWLFADTPAADGASKKIDGEEAFDLYKVIKSAYRDEYKTVTMAQLYLKLDQFDTADEIKAEAQKIIDDFNAGSDKSAEAFAKLAEKYTTDDVTVSTSGVSKEVSKSSADSYAEINEWLFSEERKKGDAKYFVLENKDVALYAFEEFGKPAWKAAVESSMKSDDYTKLCDELAEKYPVTVNEKAISKIS
ncbi:MAG: hypothetical protein II777_06595 [Clostridia bacterium]|nr:hypothetical protein [Clostridia bacterium]